jgi:hypothetical protein
MTLTRRPLDQVHVFKFFSPFLNWYNLKASQAFGKVVTQQPNLSTRNRADDIPIRLVA